MCRRGRLHKFSAAAPHAALACADVRAVPPDTFFTPTARAARRGHHSAPTVSQTYFGVCFAGVIRLPHLVTRTTIVDVGKETEYGFPAKRGAALQCYVTYRRGVSMRTQGKSGLGPRGAGQGHRHLPGNLLPGSRGEVVGQNSVEVESWEG